MFVPQSVEKRWGLEKHEKLILVPYKTSRLFEIIKTLTLFSFCILTLGLAVYFNPSLIDHIYYGFWHHRKIIKIQKDPFGLVALMNFSKLKTTMSSLGWSENTQYLSALVVSRRTKKLNLDQRLKKMLTLFFLSIRQPHVIKPLNNTPGPCPFIHSESGCINGYKFAAALSSGVKTPMEDLVMTDTCVIEIKGLQEVISAFILMDGHGIQKGQEPMNIFTKKFFLHHLRTYLNAYLKEGFNLCGVYEAFKASFSEIIENYPNQRSGTTFLGIFFINHMMFCVSIGDSKAFLIDPFLQVPIALTAEPTHPYFAKKLLKIGAQVLTHHDVSRVEGVLNMAAALGDKHITSKNGSKAIKPIMSFIAIAETWIQTPAYILLGSDGVFDHIECSQMETITRLENPLIKKAEDLVNLAYTQGSKDNLSTLIIKI